MDVTYRLIVDVSDKTKLNEIIIKKGDKKSRTVIMTVVSNGALLNMEEVIVATVKGIKPDGHILYDDAQIDEKGRIVYQIPEEAAQVPGKIPLEITLSSKEEELLTSFEIYLFVENQLFDENEFVSESDLNGFRAYLIRALNAAERAEAVENTFQIGNGAVEDILNDLREEKDAYEKYLIELQEKVERGELNGEQGPPGQNGSNAIVQEANLIIGFQIIEENLICFYFGDSDKPPHMNDEGELILEY